MKRPHVFWACVFLAACTPSSESSTATPPASAEPANRWSHGAMVSAANPAAVDAAIAVLERGGHAVDAAIAAHAVLGLVEPESSGIGGSAFMLVYDRSTDTLTVYDGRETAPAGLAGEMFTRDGQPMGFMDLWPAGVTVGVPGAVALYQRAHDDFGHVSWSELFNPAIELAGSGFEVTPKMAGYLDRMASIVDLEQFPAMAAYLYPDGKPLTAGTRKTNPEYAETLTRIAAEGATALYSGSIGEAIAMRAQAEPMGSKLTLDDLQGYEAVRRDAVCGNFRTHRICSVPPPSSGITHIMIPALYDKLKTDGDTEMGDKIQRFVDAQRLAYADRDHFVADPAFVDVPVDALIHPDYLSQRALQRFAPDETPVHGDPSAITDDAAAARRLGSDETKEAVGTSHLSIIDAEGNAVSMTASVGFPYGSLRMVNGFFLNNELTDFSWGPGVDGQPAANAFAPGARPRSSMSPTIVFDKHGEPQLLTGSAGGSSIIAYTTKTILGVLDWNMSAQEAADFPNIVARGDNVGVEASADPGAGIASDLTARGYNVQEGRGENSGLHVIVVRQAGMEGAADSRRHGTVGQLPAAQQ